MQYSRYNNNHNKYPRYFFDVSFVIKVYFIISTVLMIGLVIYLAIYTYMLSAGMRV